MTRQGEFFDNGTIEITKDGHEELRRNTDPETSDDGARDAAPRLAKLHVRCLEMVGRHPGRTNMEISAAEGLLDNRTLGRRLGELEKLKKVKRGEARRCDVTGRRAATWTLV